MCFWADGSGNSHTGGAVGPYPVAAMSFEFWAGIVIAFILSVLVGQDWHLLRQEDSHIGVAVGTYVCMQWQQ